MSVPDDEHERTFAFAEIALGQMRALRQPATPRNFEIWYHYATGYHQPLNEKINALLEQRGTIDEAELDHIFDKYVAVNGAGDRIDTVGARTLDEIKRVLSTIDAAAGSASNFAETLSDAISRIADVGDAKALHVIIRHIVQSTEDMERTNRKLEARLSASRREIHQLRQHLETARRESSTDPLTRLANRKFFNAALVAAMVESNEAAKPLSLLMVDIDHFKSFNDKYGHLVGDQVLRLVATAVRHNVKGQDIAARYGGEEFVIALPNTALRSANIVADHIRRAVMTKGLVKRSTRERLGAVTVSIGAAVLRPDDTPQMLIARADKCLYAAKHHGRNRVVCETDPEAELASPVRVA